MNRLFRLPAALAQRPNCILLCIAWILAVSYADFKTNPELTLDILYLIPVAIASWVGSPGTELEFAL